MREVLQHRQHEQRNGEGQPDDQPFALMRQFGFARRRFRIFGGCALDRDRLEPDRFDRAPQIALPHHRRQIFDPRDVGHAGHAGLQHAIDLRQRLFHDARIGLVVQALQRHFGLGGRHAVTDVADPRDDLILRHQARIVHPRAALAGQIHCRIFHTRHLLRHPLDGRRAVGARHARNWNRNLFSRHTLPR